MKVAVLHGEVPQGAPADEQDVLVEVGAVSDALIALGHEAHALPVSLDLARLASELAGLRPDAAFNLVESIDGKGRLIHLCPALLDSIGLPYTGSPTEAVFTTSGKLIAKRALSSTGIDTPAWFEAGMPESSFKYGAAYIIKSVWEHASIGLEEDSVSVFAGPDELSDALERRKDALGGECYAEEFIDGREFNISLIETPDGPVVLPHAEIRFTGFPEGSRKMVGYRAKWDETSEEYANTVRHFDFPNSDAGLLAELSRISLECWRMFRLRGYARVDFRMDEDGRPWVLEVNINPCISPDSGFVAAAGMAGYGYDRLVSMILDAACKASRDRAVAG